MEDLKKVAANPLTSFHLLVELSQHENFAIRYLVASNPNTPEETLTHLGKEFPDEVLENPVVELLKLENPHSYFKRLSLARDRKTPPETLEKLIFNSRRFKHELAVLENLITHPHTSSRILLKLFEKLNGMFILKNGRVSGKPNHIIRKVKEKLNEV
ncbi:MAG: hypothetical protein ACFCAD_19785 [Pleurocapsa sp.]